MSIFLDGLSRRPPIPGGMIPSGHQRYDTLARQGIRDIAIQCVPVASETGRQDGFVQTEKGSVPTQGSHHANARMSWSGRYVRVVVPKSGVRDVPRVTQVARPLHGGRGSPIGRSIATSRATPTRYSIAAGLPTVRNVSLTRDRRLTISCQGRCYGCWRDMVDREVSANIPPLGTRRPPNA